MTTPLITRALFAGIFALLTLLATSCAEQFDVLENGSVSNLQDGGGSGDGEGDGNVSKDDGGKSPNLQPPGSNYPSGTACYKVVLPQGEERPELKSVANLIAEAKVKLEKISLSTMADEEVVIPTNVQFIDLLNLARDVSSIIAKADLPVGRYKHVNLGVSMASIRLKDETLWSTQVPPHERLFLPGSDSVKGLKLVLMSELRITTFGQCDVGFIIRRECAFRAHEVSGKIYFISFPSTLQAEVRELH